MEHRIYAKQALKKRTFFQKMLGQKPKENALIEINNLLAEKDLRLITVDEIHNITNKYGVNLISDFGEDTFIFYRNYLTSCLEDKFLSEEEIEDLKNLKKILGLSDKDVNQIHAEMSGSIYKDAVDKVIEDGELDEQERVFIEKLQKDLNLSDEIASNIYQQRGEELIKNMMSNAISDSKLNPKEEKELYEIAKNLNAEIKMDSATKSSLEKYKLYWKIENDEMPELADHKLAIPRSEKVYFKTNSIWFENIDESLTIDASPNTLSIKIAKGLYWRKANEEENIKNLDKNWKAQDEGNLYLTNKRILFKGKNGDKIILLSRIIDFSVFANGIEIQREGGKIPFLKLENTSDIFAMLLGKSISQLSI